MLLRPITSQSEDHPGGGVKEQTASLYAKKLAQEGFTTVCFDASHQGESGGEPHFLEDPSQRVSDVWSVVDYLEHLDFVDPDKIAVVGICAGGVTPWQPLRQGHHLGRRYKIDLSTLVLPH